MPVPKTELGYVPNDGWVFCLFGTKCLRVGQKIPSKPSQAPGQGVEGIWDVSSPKYLVLTFLLCSSALEKALLE